MQRLLVKKPGPITNDSIQLQLLDQKVRPAGKDHIVVEVKSSPISIYDFWIRMGLDPHQSEEEDADNNDIDPSFFQKIKSIFLKRGRKDWDPQTVLGMGGLGKVCEVSDNLSSDLKMDDFVFFISDGGSHASHISIPMSMVVKIPPPLTRHWSILASIPVDFLAAYQMLQCQLPFSTENEGRMKAKKLLVINGETGIGMALIQVAVAMELIVYASAPITFHAQIEQLGAIPVNLVYRSRRHFYRSCTGGGVDLITMALDPMTCCSSDSSSVFKTLKQFELVLNPGGTLILHGPLYESFSTHASEEDGPGRMLGLRLGLFSFKVVQKIRNLGRMLQGFSSERTRLVLYDYLKMRKPSFQQDMKSLLGLIESDQLALPKARARIPWSEVSKYYAKMDEMGRDAFGGHILLEPFFMATFTAGATTYESASLYESI